MALGRKQQQKYHKIKKNHGAEIANSYSAWIEGGKQGAWSPDSAVETAASQAPVSNPAGITNFPQVDPTNFGQVVGMQDIYNQNQKSQSAPNVNNVFGSRSVTYDENGIPTVNESLSGSQQGLYNQSVGTQQNVNASFNNAAAQGMAQGAFQGNVQNPQFSNVAQQSYEQTKAAYTGDLEKDYSFQREQLEQQLANEGIAPGNEAYNRRMGELQDSFSNQRAQVNAAAFNQGQALGQQQYASELAGSAQQFGQNQSSYLMPHTVAAQYMPYAGKYQAPAFGAVQQFQPNQIDVVGGAASYNQTGNQNNQFYNKLASDRSNLEAQLANQVRITGMNNNTSRATAGAGSIGLGGRLALIDAQKAADESLLQQQAAIEAVNNTEF